MNENTFELIIYEKIHEVNGHQERIFLVKLMEEKRHTITRSPLKGVIISLSFSRTDKRTEPIFYRNWKLSSLSLPLGREPQINDQNAYIVVATSAEG